MRRLAIALCALLAAATALTSCSSPAPRVTVEPEPNFALPSAKAGCDGATTFGNVARIPVTVSKVAGQVAEAVNLCLEGQGPFPFVLDTGDAQSTIDASLAARLHLPSAGAPVGFAGVGCTGVAHPVSVSTWSLSGVPLAGQVLTAAHLPMVGGKGQPDGLLGSDVLSSFGAVRLDFSAGTLTLIGPQGSEPTSLSEVHGPTGPPPSPVLTEGEPSTTVPLTVVLDPGGTSLELPIRFGQGPAHVFAVDTGSSQSVVATQVARDQKLAGSNLAQRQSTVCSVITTPLVHSGPWSVPGLTLHRQLIDVTDFGPISSGGVVGLLGSDQLIRYGWVIFDYKGGRLLLG